MRRDYQIDYRLSNENIKRFREKKKPHSGLNRMRFKMVEVTRNDLVSSDRPTSILLHGFCCRDFLSLLQQSILRDPP